MDEKREKKGSRFSKAMPEDVHNERDVNMVTRTLGQKFKSNEVNY